MRGRRHYTQTVAKEKKMNRHTLELILGASMFGIAMGVLAISALVIIGLIVT